MVKERIFPQIEATITHKCNLKPRCPGCSDEVAVRHGEEDRSPEFWCRRLDELHKEYGFGFVILMGGELTTWPGIEKITAHIAESSDYDGGFYTDSVGLLKKDGTPTQRLRILLEKGKLSDIWLLVSIDYLIEKPDREWTDASRLKAYHGLRLLRFLRKEYPEMPLVLHQVVKPASLDQMIPLYEKAVELGVYYSCCTFVWKQYVNRPQNPVSLKTYEGLILTDDHRPWLREISQELIRRETERLKKGKLRSIAVSRAFLQQLSKNGIDQGYNCVVAGQPEMFDVTTQGAVRWCVARDTEEEGLVCPGCAFVCLDRIDRYAPLEEVIPLAGEVISWRNLIRNRKDPHYRREFLITGK